MKLKYVWTVNTRVRIQGATEKAEIEPGKVFDCPDKIAKGYLDNYSQLFVDATGHKNFFERHSGLWAFLALIISAIGIVFAYKQIQSQEPNNNSAITVNSGSINISNNSESVIGSNNTVSYVNTPTQTEEKKAAQWGDCETKLRAFYRRLNRRDILSSRALFDEHMLTSEFFTEHNLTEFLNKRVSGSLMLDNLEHGSIDDSEYVARCEFRYSLKYNDLLTRTQKNEAWYWVIVKYKKKNNDYQIWELRCRDRNCEEWALLNP